MPPYRLLSLAIIIAVVCGVEVIGTLAPVADAAPVQTCTSQNSQGFPVSGEVCSGSSHALLCNAGAIYLPGCSPRSMQSHQGIELYGHGIRYG